MSIEPLPFISSILTIIKDARELGKDLLKDFHEYVDNKEKNQIKKSLEEYRVFIGRIDDAYSELSMRLKEMKNSDNSEKLYSEFKDDFVDLIRQLNQLQNTVYFSYEDNANYFYKFPLLKDALRLKTFAETLTMKQMEDIFQQSVLNFEEFQKSVEYGENTTRNALIALNEHMKNNF